jgi:hypothetical protein
MSGIKIAIPMARHWRNSDNRIVAGRVVFACPSTNVCSNIGIPLFSITHPNGTRVKFLSSWPIANAIVLSNRAMRLD